MRRDTGMSISDNQEPSIIETLRDIVLWEAGQRYRSGKYQDENSAIMSVTTDLDLLLCAIMADNVADKTWRKEEKP
jgi:hypothetical protein